MSAIWKSTGFVLATAGSLTAEIETEIPATGRIPLGIEAVTGLRSNYVHRGFELADTSLDFQFETELVLSDETSLSFGFAHLAESDGDFSESSIYFEPTRTVGESWLLGASLTYRDRDKSVLQGGFDFGVFAVYEINDDWKWRNELNYDFGVDGVYIASELQWSKPLSKSAFVAINGGVSAISGYQDRDGLNDLFARISLTYALSDQVAFTPFAGFSLPLDDYEGSDSGYAGFWFEVLF